MKEKPVLKRKRASDQIPAAKPGAPGHDEWLVDEAVEESFPASDPAAPLHPGEDTQLPEGSRKK